MGLHQRNLGRNQILFREVNERIRAIADTDYPSFLCECADPECAETIEVPIAEYEEVRLIPTRFIVLPGHVISGAEHVVDKHDRYVVVEKFSQASREAAAADPRRGSAILE